VFEGRDFLDHPCALHHLHPLPPLRSGLHLMRPVCKTGGLVVPVAAVLVPPLVLLVVAVVAVDELATAPQLIAQLVLRSQVVLDVDLLTLPR
jgi:hypothetical protein